VGHGRGTGLTGKEAFPRQFVSGRQAQGCGLSYGGPIDVSAPIAGEFASGVSAYAEVGNLIHLKLRDRNSIHLLNFNSLWDTPRRVADGESSAGAFCSILPIARERRIPKVSCLRICDVWGGRFPTVTSGGRLEPSGTEEPEARITKLQWKTARLLVIKGRRWAGCRPSGNGANHGPSGKGQCQRANRD
jgi:hypothetical protein